MCAQIGLGCNHGKPVTVWATTGRSLTWRPMETEHRCPSPFGELVLQRALADHTGTLQAWDGADLLLLDHVAALVADGSLAPSARVLVIGDSFGALSISLRDFAPFVLSDSIVSETAILANHRRNSVGTEPRFVDSVLDAAGLAVVTAGPVDLVVWNISRTTELVTHTASLLAAISQKNSVVLAAGLDKNLPPRTADILRSVGQVTTHPGRRKAHVFEVRTFDGFEAFRAIDLVKRPSVAVAEHGLTLVGGPGVFSSDRFDLGSRLLAAQIPLRAPAFGIAREVVDLGCGNGVLGIVALREFPEATVHFLDDSRTAVETARRNVATNAASMAERAAFTAANVFGDDWSAPVDLVLCNPPFHHTKAMSDEVAWQMFVQSHRYLAPGGELWVVGNRHLGYHAKLTRIFGNVRQLDAHPKFVVLAATR